MSDLTTQCPICYKTVNALISDITTEESDLLYDYYSNTPSKLWRERISIAVDWMLAVHIRLKHKFEGALLED